MFLRLLPFELNLQMRQIGFMITCAVLFLFGFGIATLIAVGGGTGGERIKINGALLVTGQVSIVGITSIFFGAVYVVSGVMRDITHRSLEVIHGTPVPTPAMNFSRFTGVFLATFLSLIAGVLGLLAAQFAPWVDKELLGPFNLFYYLYPIILFLGINALVVSAIFTLIATATRQRTLVYVSAIALFILYTMAGSVPSDVAPKLLLSLIDPFGDRAFTFDSETWSAAEQNTQLVPLNAYFGLNRAFWFIIALGMFAISFLLSPRGIAKSKGKTKVLGATNPSDEIVLHELAHPTSKASLPIMWARLKLEYLTSVKSVAFIVLSALFIPFFAVFILAQFYFVPETPIPTSRVLSAIVFLSATTPMVLMAIFFGGEIVWRDKTAKVNELVDATPSRNWPLLAGKWLALYAIILTLVIMGILVGMIGQLVMGNPQIELFTYLSAGFIGFAPRILFFATLVMFVQNFMPNRIAGMIVGGLIIGFFFIGYGFLPHSHPLMNFGTVPGGGFSEMGGYSNLTNYVPFLIYWTGLCAIFSVLSVWVWRRGLQVSLIERLKTMTGNMSLPSIGAGIASVIVFVGSGVMIYQGYNVENEFLTPRETEQQLAQYEKDLGDKFDIVMPKIRDVRVDVQMYPSSQSAEVSGSYKIENTTDAPLEELYLTVPLQRDNGVNKLELIGARQSTDARDQDLFEEYSVRLYKFERPLGVGETTDLNFDLSFATPTIGARVLIRKNGTFRNNRDLMPSLGVPQTRLQNPATRRKYDLAELPALPDRDDKFARTKPFIEQNADYVNFEAKVCTDPGQTPFAPGTTIRVYEENGRPCRDYKPNEPIIHFYAFTSADYAILEDSWTRPNGEQIKLGIYYDKQHAYNVEIMMQAMKDSLKVFTETFGPYQYDTLRIMEFPFNGFAQSFPNTIAFGEGIGFVTDPGDKEDNQSLDLATYVTMHEIGHQWFGHQIYPATTKGLNVLSEGLTENASMTAYEKTYGWQKARRVLQRRTIDGIQGYLIGQAGETRDEEPLATARAQQQYLVYAKASWVFWGLKQYIGEDNMQGAIRAFLGDYGRKGPPYPTTLELIEYLREAAGPDYQQLITDYWDRITFWELAIDTEDAPASLTAEADGTYKVALTVETDKLVSSKETGRATSVLEAVYADPEEDEGDEDADEDSQGELLRAAEALNEWVEIGFYEQDPAETFGDEWIKLERVHITQAETKLTFNLETKPNYVLLDPRRLLIERNVTDNEVALELAEES